MRVSLATSLHLNHGACSFDARPGDALSVMQTFVPMGLLSLKASADAASMGAAISVIELNGLLNEGQIENDATFYEHLAETILTEGDDLVGLMTDADSLQHTIALAAHLKRLAPHALVGLGGPASTPIAKAILQRFQSIDFVVRGEGEETFTEYLATLITGHSPENIRGLTWRHGNEVAYNLDRGVIEDLDRLPLPAFEAYAGMDSAALYLDVGRGCPFKCTFCATAPFWQRRFRMKSINRILSEMQLLRDRWGRRHVNFSHDIFTCDQKWTHDFCEAAKAANLGVSWSCSTRTDVIEPGLLARMAEAGCVEIYYGIETGSQAMQALIAKNLDLEWSRKIVAATATVGIRPVTGFIVGYPEETAETFADTVDRFFDFLEVGGYRAHLFSLCPFPGAPMFHDAATQVSRRAHYLELPLAGIPAAESQDLIAAHPDIFVSHYRYASNELSPCLVDAAEEISTHLVVLKRLWPLLLRHYDAPATLFQRWSTWIATRNSERPWRAPHHGGAADLIDFVAHELGELGIRAGPITELLRYEAIKLAAAALPLEEPTPLDQAEVIDERARVVRGDPYLTAPFAGSLVALLSGLPQKVSEDQPQWIVFARRPSGDLDTMVIGETARRLLELSSEPWPLGDLVASALLGRFRPNDEPYRHAIEVAQTLFRHGLLRMVKSL